MTAQNFNTFDTEFAFPTPPSGDHFFDPSSKLTTFLYSEIMGAIDGQKGIIPTGKELEDYLMSSILPAIKKAFPKYHITQSKLIKTWQRVHHFRSLKRNNPELQTKDGDISHIKLIQRELSQIDYRQSLHPYSVAHQIAQEVAECCFIINGKSLPLNQLVQLIWSVIQHKIPQKELRASRKALSLDLISQRLYEILISERMRFFDQKALLKRLVSQFATYKELLNYDAHLRCIAPIAAEMRMHTLNLFKDLSKRSLFEIEEFLTDQIDEKLTIERDIYPLELSHRIVALYRTQKEAEHLPKLNEDQIDELTIWSISLINQRSHQRVPLSYDMRRVVEKEIIQSRVSNPHNSFTLLVRDCTRNLAAIRKALYKMGDQVSQEIEFRAELAAHQNDMCATHLKAPTSCLAQFIKHHLKGGIPIKSLKQMYMQEHPFLTNYGEELEMEITKIIKILWYNQSDESHRSTFRLFIRWHQQNAQKLAAQLLPLIPYRNERQRL